MGRCIIVGAGDFEPEDLHRAEGDILIAADNGLTYLEELCLEPDYIIGDYDSLPEEKREHVARFQRQHPGRERTLSVAKDDTDTMAAVRWGLELGYRDYILYGALGGSRVDHTIANLQTLMFLQTNGASGTILGARQELFLLRDAARSFPEGRSGYLSLFAVDPCVFVTLRGLWYEGEEIGLRYDFPLGCSNRFLPGREAYISVHGGTALVVAQR